MAGPRGRSIRKTPRRRRRPRKKDEVRAEEVTYPVTKIDLAYEILLAKAEILAESSEQSLESVIILRRAAQLIYDKIREKYMPRTGRPP